MGEKNKETLLLARAVVATLCCDPAMLSVRDHMLITIAAAYYKHGGRRDDTTVWETGYTVITAARRVQFLLDDPDAMRERPMEISRMRRLRDARSATSVRRRGFEID